MQILNGQHIYTCAQKCENCAECSTQNALLLQENCAKIACYGKNCADSQISLLWVMVCLSAVVLLVLGPYVCLFCLRIVHVSFFYFCVSAFETNKHKQTNNINSAAQLRIFLVGLKCCWIGYSTRQLAKLPKAERCFVLTYILIIPFQCLHQTCDANPKLHIRR